MGSSPTFEGLKNASESPSRVLGASRFSISKGVLTQPKDNSKGQILIRDRKKLESVIFPIFDKYPLLTSKYFNYIKLKKAFNILNDTYLNKVEKDKLLFALKEETLPEGYTSPA